MSRNHAGTNETQFIEAVTDGAPPRTRACSTNVGIFSGLARCETEDFWIEEAVVENADTG
jgi:hypothetical protein